MKRLTPLLFSLKPNYADLIFQGVKTAELRRRVSGNLENRDVFVYVSSPIKELRGGFRVGEVLSGSPEKIWQSVNKYAGVSRATFDSYYAGADKAFALQILEAWEYKYPRSLKELRSLFGNFQPPQSYRYLTEAEWRSFRYMKKVGAETKFSLLY